MIYIIFVKKNLDTWPDTRPIGEARKDTVSFGGPAGIFLFDILCWGNIMASDREKIWRKSLRSR